MIEAAIALLLVYGSFDGEFSVAELYSENNRSVVVPRTIGEEILEAAKLCAAKRTRYRMSYPEIGYPAGDISPHEGLCCDVVVRSLRAAGIDLQELVYEDSLAARQEYLDTALRTGFSRPLNRSWIHRRTASLNLFLARHSQSLPTLYTPETAATWEPGDIVIYRRNGWETWHAAIVSDATDPFLGTPLIIDAWSSPGFTTDTRPLTSHGTIGGHYRIPEDFRERLTSEHIERAKTAWLAFAGPPEEKPVLAESEIGPTPRFEPARPVNGFGLPFLFGTW